MDVRGNADDREAWITNRSNSSCLLAFYDFNRADALLRVIVFPFLFPTFFIISFFFYPSRKASIEWNYRYRILSAEWLEPFLSYREFEKIGKRIVIN